MQGLVDAEENTAIDVHEYLDGDFSGWNSACAQDPAANLAGVTAWLRGRKLKMFASEFGGSNTTQCADMLNGMLAYMAANEEYIGYGVGRGAALGGAKSVLHRPAAVW